MSEGCSSTHLMCSYTQSQASMAAEMQKARAEQIRRQLHAGEMGERVRSNERVMVMHVAIEILSYKMQQSDPPSPPSCLSLFLLLYLSLSHTLSLSHFVSLCVSLCVLLVQDNGWIIDRLMLKKLKSELRAQNQEHKVMNRKMER